MLFVTGSMDGGGKVVEGLRGLSGNCKAASTLIRGQGEENGLPA